MGVRNQGISDVREADGFALQYDSTADPILYLGEAPAGTPTSESVWRIMRITTAPTSVKIEWAEGNHNFDNIWDDRASLVYS